MPIFTQMQAKSLAVLGTTDTARCSGLCLMNHRLAASVAAFFTSLSTRCA